MNSDNCALAIALWGKPQTCGQSNAYLSTETEGKKSGFRRMCPWGQLQDWRFASFAWLQCSVPSSISMKRSRRSSRQGMCADPPSRTPLCPNKKNQKKKSAQLLPEGYLFCLICLNSTVYVFNLASACSYLSLFFAIFNFARILQNLRASEKWTAFRNLTAKAE